MPRELAGVLLGLGCSVAWAIANVWIQRASRELGSLRAMWWAQLVGSAVLVPLSLGLEGAWSRPELSTLAITGLASALGYYGMLRAFAAGPLAAVVPVVASWSLPAVAAGYLWLGQVPTAGQLAGGGLVLLGSALNGRLARGGEWSGSKVAAWLWAAGSAVGFGAMTTGVAELRGAFGEIGVVPATWAAQWVFLAPMMLREPGILRPPERWAAVVGMAGFEAAGFVSYALATSFAPVAVVSPPASLSTLFTVAFAAVVLREPVGLARWGCILLVMAGILLLAG